MMPVTQPKMGGVFQSNNGTALTSNSDYVYQVVYLAFAPSLSNGRINVVVHNDITGYAGQHYNWCYSLDNGSTYTQVANGVSKDIDLSGVTYLKIGIYNNKNSYNITYDYTIEMI